MKVAAIICEYNPLHNGHMYQIHMTKTITKCDAIIAVMSGNFVQRGEPSIIDKWERTKIALKSGIDLVIELPTVYALSSAEFFAHGAVSILNNLSSVNSICFGSECGSITPLLNIANLLCNEPQDYKIHLKYYLDQGFPFPTARSKALQKYFSVEQNKDGFNYSEILSTSNNILGIEYCKSLIRNNSNIVPYTLTRVGSGYNDENISNGFSSATAIRKFLRNNRDIENINIQLPKASFDIIMQLMSENYEFTYSEHMYKYIKYRALTDIDETMMNLKDAGEGLYNRIYKFINSSNSMEELINNIKTKRYTYTRISRILTQYFIGFQSFDIENMLMSNSNYIRVLGFTSKGAEILSNIKRNSELQIITKLPQSIQNPMLKLDIASTRAYSNINKNVRYNEDYLTSPIIY